MGGQDISGVYMLFNVLCFFQGFRGVVGLCSFFLFDGFFYGFLGSSSVFK